MASTVPSGINTLFNPLKHPILWTQPERVSNFSVWRGHLPFAMLLIDLLRPRLFVELGTHYGDSYCAFCQAVALLETQTRCFAVDTWKGDPHAGFYDDAVLTSLRAHHDPRYGSFSTLVRATFDEAVLQFEDNSIDLLHIDGLHTYEAVKHDFETYLPKLSERAVVLFHDTAVRDEGFGVYRFWHEVQTEANAQTFEFTHAGGLGVLALGGEAQLRLQFLTLAGAEQTELMRSFFERLAMPSILRADAATAASTREETTMHLQRTREELTKHQAQIADMECDREALRAHVKSLEAHRDELESALRTSNEAHDTLRAKIEKNPLFRIQQKLTGGDK